MPKSPTYSPILDDLPSDVDKLGFEPYAQALSDILLDPNTHTPLTLGLFGSWGSGKTSLMRQMQQAVEKDGEKDKTPRYRTVWFNAWKYNQEDALWRALLLVLLDDLERLLKEDPPAKRKKGEPEAKPSAEELLDLLREALYHETSWSEQGERSINWSQALTAGAGIGLNLALSFLGPGLAAAGMAADTLQEARKELGKGAPVSQMGKLAEAFRREEIVHYQAQLRSLEQFQRNFALLIETLLQPTGEASGRLVIFVDDLDRCLPEKTIQVLEALKLFLDVPGCIFVLALDNEAIESAIRRRYQGEVKAREYLEKIVQVPFILPPIETEPMRAYVQSLAPALPDPRCAEVFAVGLGANPRQVKRILNIFLLLSRLVERRPELKEAIQPVRLAKIVAIQHTHRDLYDLVKLTTGYLSDLDNHFRESKRGERLGEEGAARPALPEALAPFGSRSDLERLFLCVEAKDASFAGQKPEALRPYITLARQAAPVEAPAVQVARLAFEPEMVAVPAGAFQMGTSQEQIDALLKRYDWAREVQGKGWFDREQPEHKVTLGAFEIGRYPVLNVEYAEFMRATGARASSHWPGGSLPEELADHPMVNVTWREALAYVQWLANRTGKPYRLPTEAEWEKAASWDPEKKQKRIWPWGNDWNPALVNCEPAGPGRTTPRGQYSPAGDSFYGCADMAGNVWEWCNSLWGADPAKPLAYPYRPDDGRENLTAGGLRILRGGSWYNDNPAIVRCAYRWGTPDSGFDGIGFRVARGPLI